MRLGFDYFKKSFLLFFFEVHLSRFFEEKVGFMCQIVCDFYVFMMGDII